MDIQFFIDSIKSGGIYDILKIGGVGVVKELASKLRDIFGVQSFSKKEYDKLADIIEKVDKTYLLAEDIFIAYLKNSEELKKFLDGKGSRRNNFIVEVEGSISNSIIGNNNSGNTIYNNKVDIHNGIDYEKK